MLPTRFTLPSVTPHWVEAKAQHVSSSRQLLRTGNIVLEDTSSLQIFQTALT